MIKRPGALSSYLKNASLISALTKKEIKGRYKGSVLGITWALLNPILMLCVYTYVFGTIFRSKWTGVDSGEFQFALQLFVGLIFFNLFSECINRSTSLVSESANYVKKIIFPLETLNVVVLLSSLFHLALSSSVFLVIFFMLGYSVGYSAIWCIALLGIELIYVLGIMYLISAIGVYMKDLGQIISLVVSLTMFLTPIFYPISSIPMEYRDIVQNTPLSFLIESARAALFKDQNPDIEMMVYQLIGSIMVFKIGYFAFDKLKKGFADVI